MQDVYFLDWEVNAGDVVALKQKIGHIETSKAMSDLFAPIAGTLDQFNADLLNDPSAINVDMYGNGWLFEMTGSDTETMDAQEYYNFLEAGWEKTQNMLKGHM
jgi:glycine cleavage system H protein